MKNPAAARHDAEPGLAALLLMIATANVYHRRNVATRQVAGARGWPRPGNLEAATMTPPARTPQQRKADTLRRLAQDTDAWVATAIGPARDLVLIEGTVQPVTAAADIPAAAGDAFAVKTGFDPRELTDGYACFHIRPLRVQAWREVNELVGRDLMRDGDWVTR